MGRIGYRVSGGLTGDQLKRLHHEALRVLEVVGAEVPVPGILERISGHEGLRIEGTRVYFDPALVDDYVHEYRNRAGSVSDGDGDYVIDILSGYAFQILDPDTDELRPMTTADCIETAKLVDGLAAEGVYGGTPGLPQDVSPELCEVLAYKIGCEYSRTAGDVGITSLKAAEAVYEMAQVMDRPFGLPMFVLDPLRVEGDAINMALAFIAKGRPLALGFSSMPLLGLTCPATLPAAFVENIATVLATYAVFRAMGLANPLRYRFDVYPFDMRTGTIAYGGPEHVLIHLLGAQINRFYGAEAGTAKPFHTNALFPDGHALVQRASFAMAAALDGARRFTFGGMLGIDKIFSAEQLILDVETVNHLRSVTDGFEFDEALLGFDAIREVGPGGEFITHPTTLEACHAATHSTLFPNVSPEQWAAGDRARVKDRVRDRIRSLLARHDFELDPARRRELDRIYGAFR